MATKEPVLGEGAAAAAVADEDSSLDLGVDFSDSEGEERVADGEERRGRPALFVDSDASAGASIAGDYSYSDGELLDCSDFSDGQVSAPFLLSIRVFPSFPSLALTLPLFPAPLSLSPAHAVLAQIITPETITGATPPDQLDADVVAAV